ncbi:methionine ABC transporter ATP-binding protein [Fictibacillus phosphorivorans]|uniref:methionine ABC transporter ATP-binding protein n=1 Tax=Fictibacillus phosphorivorans TaxID=1221500 RepID=UPI00203BFB49|nr:methionine ABC transporter ATP-binding protein [Fictibacillus phosphorivorans]MCM3720276.1 methionine ABC transporter ATP-binding protein [Fictibacillus phosphorivorans]MCM3777966.1 methionine ABC transporter ATP-binding protein [Fictibacillus phosphorivorans]
MIEVRDVTKIYTAKGKDIVGVKNVSLTIEKGEIFGIVGYSGAGKSSLLRCLNLLEKPTSGEILIDGVPITTLSKKELREERLKIGMIFQHFHLISAKTVFENIAFALRAAGKKKAEINQKTLELLQMVGLENQKDQYPAQLSGGQKQRVGIARALANDPKVLLCDEATSALDPNTTKSILSLLKSINKKLGITIVLITHEMEVVKEICHRMAVMQDGEIIEAGDVYNLFAHPEKELTKTFISSVIQMELPEPLLKGRKGVVIKIHFKGAIAEEAVVSELFQNFKVKGNILHGKIEYIQETPLGIFIMELLGEEAEVKRAITYIKDRIQNLEVVKQVA